jgi:hypothetical protein
MFTLSFSIPRVAGPAGAEMSTALQGSAAGVAAQCGGGSWEARDFTDTPVPADTF